MKNAGSKMKPLTPENSNNNRHSKSTDLIAIFDNVNASIWTINSDYCLEFGNVEFQNECIERLGQKIKIGASVLAKELYEETKNEWRSYYDQALKGESFSLERKLDKSEKWKIYYFSPITNNLDTSIGVSVVSHDVSKQVIAEKKLKSSNMRFEELVEMLPEAIFEMDPNFNLTYVNRYALNLFGYSQNDLERGLSGLEMLIPEHRELAKQNFQKRVKGENPGTIEYKAQKKDGTIFPIHFHANTIITNGNLIGVRGVIVDLTDRNEAVEKLQAHKEMLSLFVKHSPIFTFIKDITPTKSRVLYASDNYKEMIGIPGTEMVGKSMEELFPPEFAAKITADDWNIVTNGKVLQLDEDLNNRHYTTIKFPIVSDNKTLLAGYTIDITDRKLTQEQQERMAQMLDLAPNSIIIHDFSGNIHFANKKTFEFLGYSEKEFSFFNLRELGTPETIKRIPEIINQIENEGQFTFQVDHVRKNGTILPLEVTAVTTKWDEKDAIISIGSDITERLNNEKALKESEEKFKTIAENSPDAIFLVDTKGNYVYANQSASYLLGYSIEELLNLNIKNLGEQDKEGQRFQQLLKDGKLHVEMPLQKKDGSFVDVDLNALILPNGLMYGICRDLTERKKVEIALRTNRTFLKETQKIANLGTYAFNIISGTWESSEIMDNIFGINSNYTKTLESWLSIIHPEWAELMKDYLINNVISEKGTFNKEYKIIRLNDKKERWIHGIGKLEFDNAENPIRMIGTIQDITEIKQIQEELIAAKEQAEENEANYRELFVKMMNAFALHEMIFNEKGEPTDYKFLEVNPAWEKIVGIKAETVINKTIREIMPDIEESWIQVYGRVVKTGIAEEFEDYNKATKKYYHIYAYRPEPGKFAVLFNDITEHKISEIKTKRSFNLLNNLTSMVPGVVYQYRLYPDGHSAFPFSSPGMYDIYEVTPEEVKENATPVFSRIHPDDYDYIVETITESAQKLTLYHSEFRVILPKQGLRWRLCDAKPERLEDGSTLWYGIISDITERKNVENELIKAKEKAEQSDRLKSAFLANMSHEIRTPMNGILGFASLLKEPKLSGEEQKKYIDIIEKSGERMLNTINDIVDISKIESGQMEVTVTEINITELFDNILSFFTPEANKKEIKLLNANKLPETETDIKSDKEKLNAVLTNLVKNALKFCDKGTIEIGCVRKNNILEFYVKDTGKGIPSDRLVAIFDRFVQADIEDRDVKEGSGLGLAISKSYVELMGGKIWVESVKEKGSTFFFTIPFISAGALINRHNKQDNNTKDNMKKLNILIAEDDEVSEMLTKLMIGKKSNKILIAKTGTETVEMCKNHPDIDLILMDIKMPEMDGYNATRKIREFNKDVIIIATTAFALTGDREKALEAGCNNYLTKPLSQYQLDELIEYYFNK